MTDAREPTTEEWLDSLPKEVQVTMRRFLGETVDVGRKTYVTVESPQIDELKKQGEAFIATREPPTSAKRAKELAEEVIKAQRSFCKDFKFSDSEELMFLRRYIKLMHMVKWGKEERLKFVDELIAWSIDEEFDTQTDKNIIQLRLAEDINTKKLEIEERARELRELEKELNELKECDE